MLKGQSMDPGWLWWRMPVLLGDIKHPITGKSEQEVTRHPIGGGAHNEKGEVPPQLPRTE